MDENDLVDKNPFTALGFQFLFSLFQVAQNSVGYRLQFLFFGKTRKSYDRIKDRWVIRVDKWVQSVGKI